MKGYIMILTDDIPPIKKLVTVICPDCGKDVTFNVHDGDPDTSYNYYTYDLFREKTECECTHNQEEMQDLELQADEKMYNNDWHYY
jgi:hypothetical protein